MNQTCDRCGPAVRAVCHASRGGELYLCRHCTNQLRPALPAQGWAIRLIATPAVTPPEPSPQAAEAAGSASAADPGPPKAGTASTCAPATPTQVQS
jgi:hypothetical protein